MSVEEQTRDEYPGARASASNGQAEPAKSPTLAERVGALEAHHDVLKGREAGREGRIAELEEWKAQAEQRMADLSAENTALWQCLRDVKDWIGMPVDLGA